MKQFNADEKADQGSLEVTIGEKVFIAKEPTLAVMKQLAEAAPKSTPDEDKDKSESERMQEGIDSIFPQLEILLRSKEDFDFKFEVEEDGKKKPKTIKVAAGSPPPQQFVEEHLSMRRAGEMIQTLMGEDESDPH